MLEFIQSALNVYNELAGKDIMRPGLNPYLKNPATLLKKVTDKYASFNSISTD